MTERQDFSLRVLATLAGLLASIVFQGALGESVDPPVPGGGYGTVFEQGSITVSSETPINLEIAAADLHFIDLTVAGDLATASLTVQGLSPSTLYYVYLDDLHNLTTYTSTDDGSLSLSFVLVKAIPELPNLRHVII